MSTKEELVRHETLIPKRLKNWIKSQKKKTGLSESIITVLALDEYKFKMTK